MSITLKYGVRSPHAKGLKVGDDKTDATQYAYVAYTHPDCDQVFFAGNAGKVVKYGEWTHENLMSAVRAEPIPSKPDYNIWAIPASEFYRLEMLERLYWRDYYHYLDRHPHKEDEATAFALARVQKQERI